jgi:hypothetical protein
MVSKKSGLVITIVGVLSFLLSVTYISSCTKPLEDNPWSCNYVFCDNGGTCDSGRCLCPIGYEGSDCSKKSVAKFYGRWRVTATNIGSDTARLIGKDSVYDIEFKESASLTTFFIYNFNNNSNYNNVLCRVDSINKNDFAIDTTMAQNMFYDNYRIRGGFGFLYKDDSVDATVYIRSINSNVNWQNDTFRLKMRRL